MSEQDNADVPLGPYLCRNLVGNPQRWPVGQYKLDI